MPTEMPIDITRYVDASIDVMSRPFWNFITELASEGRVTPEEVAALRERVAMQRANLVDLAMPLIGRSGPKT